MKRHQPLFLALAVVTMAVVGWNLGGNSGEKPAAPPLSAATRSSRPERMVRTRPGPSGEAARRLEAIRATANPSERLRATIDLANFLSAADFAAWMNGSWFNLRGGMESTVFNGILMERWRQEDPEGLLLWALKNDSDMVDSMFSVWAETEPQRLVDFFKSHPDDRRELAALEQIAEKHPELALRRLQEKIASGISRDDAYVAMEVLEAAANQSPVALQAILDALPVSLKADAEEILIGRKMHDAFATELRKLQGRPDGFELLRGIYNRTRGLDGRLIEALTALPASWRERMAQYSTTFIRPEDAAKWAAADLEGAGFTAEQATNIRAGAVSHLQSSEPETALKILAELDLPPDQKARVIDFLFKNFLDKPEKAEALLALLGSEEDRKIARNAFQSVPVIPEAEIALIEQPAEWLSAVGALDIEEGKAYLYTGMTENWEPEKLAALSAGFQSLPDDQKRKMSELCLASGMSDGFPLKGEVLAYLVAHPPERALFNNSTVPDEGPGSSQAADLAIRHVVELGKENPEKAGGWIAALPEGEAKWYAARNLQSIWSLYDQEAAERWMKTLPAATLAKVKELGKAGE